MDEWTGIALGAFALSSFASALQIGRWILHAEPGAIINAGRWSLVFIALFLCGLLAWLMASGRFTNAMLLASFLLPILVQAIPRWRLLLRPVNFSGTGPFTFAPDQSAGGHREYPSHPKGRIDPKLVQKCAAVLESYLEETRRQITHRPNGKAFETGPANGSINGATCWTMSIDEALDVLGIDSTATASEIGEAHRRLEEQLGLILAGNKYFTSKLNEARDILLGK
jgi:hypothetical protein